MDEMDGLVEMDDNGRKKQSIEETEEMDKRDTVDQRNVINGLD